MDRGVSKAHACKFSEKFHEWKLRLGNTATNMPRQENVPALMHNINQGPTQRMPAAAAPASQMNVPQQPGNITAQAPPPTMSGMVQNAPPPAITVTAPPNALVSDQIAPANQNVHQVAAQQPTQQPAQQQQRLAPPDITAPLQATSLADQGAAIFEALHVADENNPFVFVNHQPGYTSNHTAPNQMNPWAQELQGAPSQQRRV